MGDDDHGGRGRPGDGIGRRALLRAVVGSGATLAGTATSTGGATTDRDSSPGTATTGSGTSDGSGSDGGDGPGTTTTGGPTTHEVAMTDDPAFDPATLEVAPGDRVVWETVGSNPHTVTAYDDGIPNDADYFASGGYDSAEAAREGYPGDGAVETGETFAHTFGTPGTYEYFCVPHETAGMTGTVEVRPGANGPATDAGPAVPPAAKTLTIVTTSAMLATLSLCYLFLRFGLVRGER